MKLIALFSSLVLTASFCAVTVCAAAAQEQQNANNSDMPDEPVMTTAPVNLTIPEPAVELYGFATDTPALTLHVGEEYQLKTVWDDGCYIEESLLFLSDSNAVAVDRKTGLIQAQKEGAATVSITAKLNPEKVDIAATDMGSRTIKAAVKVMDPAMTDEQRAKLEELAKIENRMIGEYKRERAVILGKLEPDAARLTRDEVNGYIESSGSFREILQKVQSAQAYPDFIGGSGVTNIEYWFDNRGNQEILMIPEQEDMIYVRHSEDGNIIEWQRLYPAEREQNFDFASCQSALIDSYAIYNDVDASGDVNADGTFSTADAVLLQKWLPASPDTRLLNWKAADFKKDNQLDAVDLTLMKRELLNKSAS